MSVIKIYTYKKYSGSCHSVKKKDICRKTLSFLCRSILKEFLVPNVCNTTDLTVTGDHTVKDCMTML